MFFVLSKIFWAVANPGNLFILSLVAGSLGLLAPWRRLRTLAGWILGLAIGTATVITIVPVGAWLLAPLEDRFPPLADPPARVDGIVLLGGALNLQRAVDRGGTPLNSFAERVTAFVELARRYPNARLVFSGGSSLLFNQIHREADYAATLLETLGVPPDRVIFERESRNTHENARNAAALAQPRPGEGRAGCGPLPDGSLVLPSAPPPLSPSCRLARGCWRPLKIDSRPWRTHRQGSMALFCWEVPSIYNAPWIVAAHH